MVNRTKYQIDFYYYSWVSLLAITLVLVFGTIVGFESARAQVDSLEQPSLAQQIINPVDELVPSAGGNNSGITIVEFGDYICIHCSNFNRDVKDLLISEYVDSGQANFIYKDFPVNDRETKLSTLAAEASYCAAEQDKYWEYHDELFRNTKRDTNQNWVNLENLKEFAANVGVVNGSQFESCLNSHKYVQLVKDNELLARTLEIPSTPSFVIANTNSTSVGSATRNSTAPTLILMVGEQPHTVFGEAIAIVKDMNTNSGVLLGGNYI
jgi:protein-disulfide isomerase